MSKKNVFESFKVRYIVICVMIALAFFVMGFGAGFNIPDRVEFGLDHDTLTLMNRVLDEEANKTNVSNLDVSVCDNKLSFPVLVNGSFDSWICNDQGKGYTGNRVTYINNKLDDSICHNESLLPVFVGGGFHTWSCIER